MYFYFDENHFIKKNEVGIKSQNLDYECIDFFSVIKGTIFQFEEHRVLMIDQGPFTD